MVRNKWTDLPYTEEMGAEMLALVKAQDNLTDYAKTQRLVTSSLLVKRNVQARGTTQAHHYNTQVEIDKALAAIDDYDMLNRSRFETEAVDKHNAMVDKTHKELETITREAVKAMDKVLQLTRAMVTMQDEAIASSQLMQSLNGRGNVHFVAPWNSHTLPWGYVFDSVLPPRELSIQIAKALVIRTDMYAGDADKVISMPPAISRFSHDHSNQG